MKKQEERGAATTILVASLLVVLVALGAGWSLITAAAQTRFYSVLIEAATSQRTLNERHLRNVLLSQAGEEPAGQRARSSCSERPSTH